MPAVASHKCGEGFANRGYTSRQLASHRSLFREDHADGVTGSGSYLVVGAILVPMMPPAMGRDSAYVATHCIAATFFFSSCLATTEQAWCKILGGCSIVRQAAPRLGRISGRIINLVGPIRRTTDPETRGCVCV
jgi:hypothetical protein